MYKNLDEDAMAKWNGKADKAKEVYKKQLAEYEKGLKSSEKKPTKGKKSAPKPESSDSEDSGSYASSSDSDSDDSDWALRVGIFYE